MIKKLKLEELHRANLEQFKAQKKHQVIMVLDNVRSAHNVGAAFRTCDAFAVKQLLLVGITPQPPHTDITKSAIGATLSVEYKYFENIEDCLLELKASGWTLVGLEQTTVSIPLNDFIWTTKTAIILGNEVDGICKNVLPLIDHFAEIPQFGTKHSLNVSVAGGIVLWDFIKSSLNG